MNNGKLSDRQRAILAFCETEIKTKGRAPTVREIQTALAISSSSVVHYNMKRLRREGYIYQQGLPGDHRSIQLTNSLTITFTGHEATAVRTAYGPDVKAGILEGAEAKEVQQ